MFHALASAARPLEPYTPDRPSLRFHYASRVSGGLGRGDLARIVHASWRNNARFGITGWLHFDGAWFEQVMEGQAEAVSYLAAMILADARHEAIDVRSFSLIEARSHDRWVFEGFDAALRAANSTLTGADPDNVVRADFGAGR